MFRFRRTWLLFPLLGLTLFFAACGWRNWSLSMAKEDVWLAAVAFYNSPPNPNQAADSKRAIVLSFAEGATALFDQSSGAPTPLSHTLITRMNSVCPRAHFFAAKKIDRNRHASITFVQTRLVNRFLARCRVRYTESNWHDMRDIETIETLTLKRSPSLFQDSEWHVTATGNSISNFYMDVPQ